VVVPVSEVGQTGEDAGVAAAQAPRVDRGSLQGLPRGLEQQPLLRVGGQRLTRVDLEELGVEVARVAQEPTGSRVTGTRPIRVRVVQRLQVPVAVVREVRHGVPARLHQLPQGLRGRHPAREAAGDTHHRDGLGGGLRQLPQPSACLDQLDRRPLEVVENIGVVVVRHRSPLAELFVQQREKFSS
jgi:hypothetical protein